MNASETISLSFRPYLRSRIPRKLAFFRFCLTVSNDFATTASEQYGLLRRECSNLTFQLVHMVYGCLRFVTTCSFVERVFPNPSRYLRLAILSPDPKLFPSKLPCRHSPLDVVAWYGNLVPCSLAHVVGIYEFRDPFCQ